LIPIARQYPGARELLESNKREFPSADLSYHSAAGYGGCQILGEAVRRVGSLDRNGVQIAHKGLIFQWQDGKKIIVWAGRARRGEATLPHAAVESALIAREQRP
jgi:hypothetical protein